MKHFWQIDPVRGEITMDIHSNTPREAALKVATRDVLDIWLAEVQSGKLHVFRGDRRPLEDHEHTDFTRRRNIVAKPVVQKMAYKNLNSPLTRGDVTRLLTEFEAIVRG